MYYFDNAATTKVLGEAADGALKAMRESFGNPSSLHRLGIAAERLIDISKKEILSALGDSTGSIVFTSGATESNNTAIFGLANTYGKRKRRVVTTAVEHPSVLKAFEKLEKSGFEVFVIYPDENGEITKDMLVDAVDSNTCLISAMLVNNETGYILPISEAFSKIKKKYPECYTHCDCVQGFEKLPISAKALSADIISLSGHKIHAPKGVGAMYIKKGVRFSPMFYGGGQQKDLRSGTESVPLIYAMGCAVSVLSKTLKERYDNVKAINEYAKSKLSCIGCPIISKENASPYILSIAVPSIKSETMLHYLENKDIFVSGGSACSKGKKSSVIAAFRVSEKLSDSVIRLSFSYETKTEDIDALAEAIALGMKELAKIR